jgi:hypothetical protein
MSSFDFYEVGYLTVLYVKLGINDAIIFFSNFCLTVLFSILTFYSILLRKIWEILWKDGNSRSQCKECASTLKNPVFVLRWWNSLILKCLDVLRKRRNFNLLRFLWEFRMHFSHEDMHINLINK